MSEDLEKKDDIVVEVGDNKIVDLSNDKKDDEIVVDVVENKDEKADAPATVIADDKADSLVIEVAEPVKDDQATDKKSKRRNKKHKKVETEVVEVSNIPTEVVSNKNAKKKNKISSFFAFATIVLALVFTIVDWTVSSVTKDPQIVLHLMDWISIILYLTLAIKALPFLNGKKNWVKGVFWVCVIATLVCIIVPMVLDYVDLAKAIEAAQQQQESAKNAAMLLFA